LAFLAGDLHLAFASGMTNGQVRIREALRFFEAVPHREVFQARSEVVIAQEAERRTMSVIRWKLFAAGRNDSLCGTCIWGTLRKGYKDGEVQTFCRLIGPNGLVPFPIRECNDYVDRRGSGETVEAKSAERRYGFVTTISLRDEKS
jgi:hypothetical protein